MKPGDLYINNKRLILGERIGKGGEGEVYLLNSEPDRAIKIYQKSDQIRETKVREMIKLGLSSASNLISFPEETVTDRSGKFVGFSMRLVRGHRPIHELYGVKSRKAHFPRADFRFLVRAAANTARAIGQVHNSPCVIGDINHSGLLVSGDATVALIDADSFQLRANGETYPCLVGVPDFTPPELHGLSLRGLVRTQQHDRFGLAVVIFQLLLMGRHPYAGRQKNGDFPLDQLIARNLFAYSRVRKLEVSPPLGAAALDDFPAEVSDAFERAFGTNPSERPSAIEWVEILQLLEKQLNRCEVNSIHYFPSAAKKCPWCHMEAISGAILFISSYLPPLQIPLQGNFDIEEILSSVRGLSFPTEQAAQPKLPRLPTEPSKQAKWNVKKRKYIRVFSFSILGILGTLWFAFPPLAIVWIGALVGAYIFYQKVSSTDDDWRTKYIEKDSKWNEGLERWKNNLGLGKFHEIKRQIERDLEECRSLPHAEAQALNRLKAERRQRQLLDYLDRYLIRNASITSIGPTRKITLASFGIETAADISKPAINNIPGFGPAMAEKLMRWRSNLEMKFVYNTSYGPADAQAEAKVRSEIANKLTLLRKKISKNHSELTQVARHIRQQLSVEIPHLSRLAEVRAQLKIDLEHLGISVPAYQKPNTVTAPQSTRVLPATQGTPSVSHNPGGQVACPRCGSRMVQRRARRGRRSGSLFWGCSTYPRCRGTRN